MSATTTSASGIHLTCSLLRKCTGDAHRPQGETEIKFWAKRVTHLHLENKRLLSLTRDPADPEASEAEYIQFEGERDLLPRFKGLTVLYAYDNMISEFPQNVSLANLFILLNVVHSTNFMKDTFILAK